MGGAQRGPSGLGIQPSFESALQELPASCERLVRAVYRLVLVHACETSACPRQVQACRTTHLHIPLDVHRTTQQSMRRSDAGLRALLPGGPFCQIHSALFALISRAIKQVVP